MRAILSLTLLSLGLSCASSASSLPEAKSVAPLCVVLATNGSLAAGFSLKNPARDTWSWNNPDSSSDPGPEYAWLVEPGTLRHGRFKQARFAFGVSYRSVLPEGTIEHGKFEELLSRMKYGSVYLNSSDKNEQRRVDESLKSMVVKAYRDQNELFVVTRDTRAIAKILADKPTHARLTSILPYQNESYSCVAEITYE